jgi:hypothetical protein
LSRDAARYLLSLRFDDNDVSRMNELSELARLADSPRWTRLNSIAISM